MIESRNIFYNIKKLINYICDLKSVKS